MKLAILSNVNIDLLANNFSPKEGETEFYIGGFNQYVQELLDDNSGLYKFAPDVVIVHLNGAALFEPYIFNPFSDIVPEATGREEAENFFQLINNAARRLPQTIFLLNSIVLPPDSILGHLEYNSRYSVMLLQQGFNLKLRELKLGSENHNIVICPLDCLITRENYSEFFDVRYWYLGRIPYSSYGLAELAKLYQGVLSSVKGKTKKVIVLDLDNTLWGGIIGEDGVDGIALGEEGTAKAYRDFQRLLKAVKAKGVLLAIVSKNNEEDAFEVFKKHPMMVLSSEDFVAMKINWQPKSVNLCQLAEELNLGLDAFVVIDDNSAERMEITSQLPQVAAPEFPADLALLPDWFISVCNCYFNTLSITSEDVSRSEFYKTEAKRKKLQQDAGSLVDFFKKLEMQAIIGRNTEILIPRISQLTQRTNQFNLTTNRYGESEIAGFMKGSDTIVYDIEINDRFGSNGVVGVIIVRLEKEEVTIDTFLLSCRVIGRTIENAFAGHVLAELAGKKIKKVTGIYKPTAKNVPAKKVYEELGFQLAQKHNDGSQIWTIDLVKKLPAIPEYIDIKKRE